MAYCTRKPTGLYWSKHIARTHKICMGTCEHGVKPGEIYYIKKFRLNARPTVYCSKCAKLNRD